MEEKIKNLIKEHSLQKIDCFGELQEFKKLSDTNISKKEKEQLEIAINCLEQAYSLRSSFISELEELL